jgi:hypothetical protein
MRRVLSAFAIVLGLTFAASTADAYDQRHRPAPSVFPKPHDPWRSWGVHRELPRHLPPPHVHRGFARGGGVIVSPAPTPVWVPGRWWWDGWGWRWTPGYWVY